jgi:hypothetical protein
VSTYEVYIAQASYNFTCTAMEQIQTNAVMVLAMVSQHMQFWLRKVLLWLIDEEGKRTVKTIGENTRADYTGSKYYQQ